MVPGDGLVQVLFLKVGPENGREIQLGVGQLPDHEVADAALAAGADQQVGCRAVGGGQIGRQGFGREVGGTEGGVVGLPALHGLHDVQLAAVVDGDVELQAGAGGGLFFGAGDQALDGGAEAAFVANDAQLHALGFQGRHFALQVAAQQGHEAGHFVGGAAPVFGAEGEDGEALHLALCAGFDEGAHPFGPGAVAKNGRQFALLCPAAVAVHDDGQVLERVDDATLMRVKPANFTAG